MMNNDHVFNRIIKLLDDIASVKEASDTNMADKSSVSKTKPTADPLASVGSLDLPDPDDAISYASVGQAGASPNPNATFVGEDPKNEKPSKTVGRLDFPLEKYKKHASAVPTEELLKDAVSLGNSILYDIIQEEEQPVKQAHAPAQVQNTNEKKEAVVDTSTFEHVKTAEDVVQLSSGVLDAVKKQAEFHAQLVGEYLYGNLLSKSLVKAAEEEEKADEEKEKEEDSEPADTADNPAPNLQEHKEPVDALTEAEEKKNSNANGDSKEPEEEAEKKLEKEVSAVAENAAQDAAEKTVEEGSASDNDSLDLEEALGALNEMDSAGGNNEKEILEMLATALSQVAGEQGLPQLEGLGEGGAKLASAIKKASAEGKLKPFKPNTLAKKLALDYMKSYVSELLTRSTRKRVKV
jgi:hypothetical protein